MKICLTGLVALLTLAVQAAEMTEEGAVREQFRAKLAPGGDFYPDPQEGVFVAAGHGLNVVVSRDDGKTWARVFYAGPCGDHGPWAVWDNVAYTEGVFAIASGWGSVGTVIASDDGQNWRHLAGTDRNPGKPGAKPYDMRNTMQLIGVNGCFIMPLEATPDFGKTWFRTSAYDFKNDQGERLKLNLQHPALAAAVRDGGRRVIVVADAGPVIFSDDLGRTWQPLQVDMPSWAGSGAQGIIAKDGVFLILKGDGRNVLRSADGGITWTSHELGIERPEGRSFSLSVAGDEFWVAGRTSKASKDGITWRSLPAGTPSGRIAVSDRGTIICVSRSRNNILRSTDGQVWQEVYTFAPEGSGGAQGLAGIGWGRVRKITP
jgi:photosystem II stability/assembly factor-like uncharacterized protein